MSDAQRRGTLKDLLRTPDQRALMYELVGIDVLFETTTATSTEQLHEEKGRRNQIVNVVNALRSGAPQMFALMITESGVTEEINNERSRKRNEDRRDSPERHLGG